MSILSLSLLPSFWGPSPSLSPSSPIARILADDFLLSLVLRFLTRHSFRYALVCKRWYAAACLWPSHLGIKSKIRFAALLPAIRRFPSLMHVTLGHEKVVDANGDALFQCLGATCPRLTHLTVHYQFRMRVTSAGVSALFCGCRGLRDLRLFTLCALPHLPPAVSVLSDLRVLHLSRHHDYGVELLEHLTNPPDALYTLQQLQEIHVITHSPHFQGLPDCLSRLTSLTSLTFEHPSLSDLPPALGCLPLLQTLDVRMKRLTQLPDTLQQLTRLKQLSLEAGRVEWVPEGVMAAMSGLKDLSLCCKRLKGLPHTMCSLPLISTKALPSLPENLGKLTNLETLKLHRLPGLSFLPESVGDLPRLKSLELNCLGLQQLPEQLCSGWVRESLRDLDMRSCDGLRQLPLMMAGLTRLERLSISGCTALQSLEPLAPSLPPADLTRPLAPAPAIATATPGATAATPPTSPHVKAMQQSEPLRQHTTQHPWGLLSLTALDLYGCPRIDSLPEALSSLSALQSLTLSHLGSLSCLPDSLGQLKNLTFLKLYCLGSLSRLPKSLAQMENLEELELCYLPNLNELPTGMRWLPSLRETTMIDVGRVTDWWWVDYLPAVRDTRM